MSYQTGINPVEVRIISETIILNLGYRIAEGMPPVASFVPRHTGVVIRRLAVTYALHAVSLGLPGTEAKRWLDGLMLETDLCEGEQVYLALPQDDRQHIVFSWYAESAMALLWSLSLVPGLSPAESAPPEFLDLFPDITAGEGLEKFTRNAQLRPLEELYQMADLYYRLHWSTSYARLNNLPGPVSHSLVTERRRALTWLMHPEMNWESVDMRFHILNQRL